MISTDVTRTPQEIRDLVNELLENVSMADRYAILGTALAFTLFVLEPDAIAKAYQKLLQSTLSLALARERSTSPKVGD